MIGHPSNIPRQQFKLIRPDLEAMRQRTRPRQVDLYEILVQNTIGAEVVIAKQSDLRRLWCTCKRQL